MVFVVWCMLNFNPELTVRANLTPGKSTEAKVRAPVAGAVPGTNTDADTGTVPVPTTPGITHAIPGYGLHIDDSALKRNQRAIERHVDYDHYVRCFTPGDFVLTGATHITDTSAFWSAVQFADAAVSYGIVTFCKPSEWRSGKLATTIWYTSNAGSTNNFRLGLAVRAIRDGEVLGGTALLTSAANVPGPGVANTVIRYGPTYTTTSFGNDDELFSFRVLRDGTHANDTNVNNLLLLYAKVEHIQAVRESQ